MNLFEMFLSEAPDTKQQVIAKLKHDQWDQAALTVLADIHEEEGRPQEAAFVAIVSQYAQKVNEEIVGLKAHEKNVIDSLPKKPTFFSMSHTIDTFKRGMLYCVTDEKDTFEKKMRWFENCFTDLDFSRKKKQWYVLSQRPVTAQMYMTLVDESKLNKDLKQGERVLVKTDIEGQPNQRVYQTLVDRVIPDDGLVETGKMAEELRKIDVKPRLESVFRIR